MTILVKIFGDLRYQIKGYKPKGMLPLNIELESEGIKIISDILDKLRDSEMITIDNDHIKLTEKALFISNSVVLELI